MCNTVSGQECEYRYTRQPPVTLNCNPYGDTRLVLTCTAEGPSFSVTVIWMRQRNGTDEFEGLHDTQIGIIIDVTRAAFRHSSRLTVNGLNEVDDVGDYWCQVRLENGTVLQKKSNILTLSSEAQYQGLGRCNGSQFVDKVDCIHPPQVTVPNEKTPNNGPVVQTTASSSNLSLTPQSTDGAMEASGSKNMASLYTGVAFIVLFSLIIVTFPIILVVLCGKKSCPLRFTMRGKYISSYYIRGVRSSVIKLISPPPPPLSD